MPLEWDRVEFFLSTSAKFCEPVVSTGERDGKGAELWEGCILPELQYKSEVQVRWRDTCRKILPALRFRLEGAHGLQNYSPSSSRRVAPSTEQLPANILFVCLFVIKKIIV